MKRIIVDQENEAHRFWSEIEANMGSQPEAIRDVAIDLRHGVAENVPDEVAEAFHAWASDLPGYEEEDAPEYAPHPYLIQNTD